MAQFDVYRNTNRNTAKWFPFLVEVQSDVFEDSNRAVYVPLVHSADLKKPDKVLNAEFKMSGVEVRLFPLDIASAPRNSVGDKIGDISDESDKIVAALDLLFARF